jgi:alpha-tubulin suppressor-like RCC1 family protein
MKTTEQIIKRSANKYLRDRGYVAAGLRELAEAGITAKAIVSGQEHTCLIDSNAAVRCWGRGTYGRLGYDNSNQVGGSSSNTVAAAGTVNMGAGITAKAISAGYSHTCVIDSADAVRCWGNGNDGRLGYGSTTSVGSSSSNTVAAAGTVNMGGKTAKAISVGKLHTCVIDSADAVRCWGYGAHGQLGYGNTNGVGDGIGATVAAAGTVSLSGKKSQGNICRLFAHMRG